MEQGCEQIEMAIVFRDQVLEELTLLVVCCIRNLVQEHLMHILVDLATTNGGILADLYLTHLYFRLNFGKYFIDFVEV